MGVYVNKGEEVDSVLEKCIITDKFGKMHSSRMDYELLTHDRSKNVTISIPEDDKKKFISGSTIEFIFLCSNHKKITTWRGYERYSRRSKRRMTC